MIVIDGLPLKSNLVLSPMAGISDLPFRMLNREFGAELCFVEMINCRSISHKSRRTKAMLSSNLKDRPLGVQLLGCEENFILRALDALKEYKFDLLDFNAACPAKKVVRRGEGAALMNDPKKLKKLLKAIIGNSLWPITIKIRAGWDSGSVNARDIAVLAEDAGVKAVFVHGRTKVQGYSGSVDYSVIKSVKKSLEIPVIASGDILSGMLAKKMLEETGCDGLAVARGSLGNPWIFKEIKHYLKKGQVPKKPSVDEISRVMLKHLDSSVEFYGERNGVLIFRKFFSWYTKGLRKIRHLREKSSRIKTKRDMSQLVSRLSC